MRESPRALTSDYFNIYHASTKKNALCGLNNLSALNHVLRVLFGYIVACRERKKKKHFKKQEEISYMSVFTLGKSTIKLAKSPTQCLHCGSERFLFRRGFYAIRLS